MCVRVCLRMHKSVREMHDDIMRAVSMWDWQVSIHALTIYHSLQNAHDGNISQITVENGWGFWN